MPSQARGLWSGCEPGERPEGRNRFVDGSAIQGANVPLTIRAGSTDGEVLAAPTTALTAGIEPITALRGGT